ncbi:MAG: YfhO family protein [Cytophagales bacterium]
MFLKKALPHIVVIAIVLLITYFFMKPSFQGKVLEQHDIAQWRGGAQELIDYKEHHNGQQSHWTNSMFGGMPSYFVSLVHEGNKSGYVLSTFYDHLKPPVVQTVVSLLCFYILMVSLGFSPWVAIIGAFAYAYASFNLVSLIAGHNAKLNAYATIPLMFAGITYAFKNKNYLLGGVLLATGIATNLVFNHFQITYYALVGSFIYGLYFVIEGIRTKEFSSLIKPVLALVVGAVIGLGTNTSALLTTQEYSDYSIRGKSELHDPQKENSSGIDKSYAFEYSYGLGETSTLWIPGIYGGSSNEPVVDKSSGEKVRYPLYHGDLGIAAGTIYIGTIIVALAIMALFIVENNIKWAFVVITVVGFVLSWGKNLAEVNYLLFEFVPGLNKFRSVMMAIMLSQFSITVLALMGLHELVTKEVWSDLNKKQFKNGLIAIASLFAITYLAILTMNYSANYDEEIMKSNGPQVIEMLRDHRKSLANSDFFRSLILVAIAFGLIYFAVIKESFKKNILVYLLFALVVFDLLGVDRRYLNEETFVEPTEAQNFEKTAIDEQILQDKTLHYRVYNLQRNPFTDAQTSYFHKSLGGYNPAKLRRYQDLIEKHLQENNFAVINMLNAKYIIVNDERMPVRLNPDALGNAWFVKNVKYVANPDEEIAALKGFDPKNQAIMDKSKFTTAATTYTVDSSASISLKEYQPNKLAYEANNSQNGLAVFSEIYYPFGWTAKIDGKEVNVKRVNYVLRALEIPAGKHTIEFSFESPSYKKGYSVSLICSVLMLISLVAIVGFELFKSIKK